MVVAVVAVGMVQVPVHQVINMITMRYGRMPAIRSVNVVFVVTLAYVVNAPGGVFVRDRYDMLVIVVLMGAVQVPVVQVSHMVTVFHGDVTAARTVFMVVVLVDGVGHDSNLPTSFMNRYGRVGVVKDIADERFHVGVRQAIEHIPAIAPTRDEVLFQEDP